MFCDLVFINSIKVQYLTDSQLKLDQTINSIN